MYARVTFLAGFALHVSITCALAAETCVPDDPPQSWSRQEHNSPAYLASNAASPLALDLVVLRHGEKPMRPDGVMIEDGNLGVEAEHRLARLADRLLEEFGCPDLLVAANPAVKMLNKKTGQYFNYIRPLATIAPVSIKLNYPVWTPYGYNQNDLLARDLLSDLARRPKTAAHPGTVYIVWERQNIAKLYREIVDQGKLRDLSGSVATINGASITCDTLQSWQQCDFDTIWFIHIRNSGVCLSRRAENLNSASYQARCKEAESVTDAPK